MKLCSVLLCVCVCGDRYDLRLCGGGLLVHQAPLSTWVTVSTQHIKPKELQQGNWGLKVHLQNVLLSLLGPATISLLPLTAFPSTHHLPDLSSVDDKVSNIILSFFFGLVWLVVFFFFLYLFILFERGG